MLKNNLSGNPGVDLRQAAAKGDVAKVKECLKKYLDGGVIHEIINNKSSNGNTALKWAIKYKHYAVVEVLLTAEGIEICQQDEQGCTLLHRAAFEGTIELVRLLAKAGADLDKTDLRGYTALHFATCFEIGSLLSPEKIATAVFLIEQGAGIDKVNFLGLTPLSMMLQNPAPETIKLFIRVVLGKNPYREKPDDIVWLNHRGDSPQFWDACKKEISALHKITFAVDSLGSLSLCDFMKEEDEEKIVLISKQITVRDILEKTNFREQYPCFGDKILANFKKGQDRVKILDNALKVFSTAEEPFGLPIECWNKILNKLSTDFLYSLFRKPTMSSMRQGEESIAESNPRLKS